MFLPLHNYIFKILSSIEEDGTMDQHKPLNLLVTRLGQSVKYYCFDLSAATDRLPIEIQRDILSLMGISFANSWLHIMKAPYFYKETKISYAVGQPMGAYSS
jgi:hypothetical protein